MTSQILFSGDMSATSASRWVPIPDDCAEMAAHIGWPSTGTPVGTLSLEVSGHGKDGTAGAAYPITVTTNPAGTAGSVILDGIRTAAKFIRLVYTRTSGGTGASFTDDGGTTLPFFIFKVRT